MAQKKEYLVFVDATPKNRKTAVVWVQSLSHGDILGEIRWYGAWRQYVFCPRPNTVWNPDCLNTVNEHIRELMAKRQYHRTLEKGV